MATPALRALRGHFPKARLLAVATPPICRLLAAHPGIDEFLEYDRRRRHRGLRGMLRLAQELRARRPGAGIVFPHSTSSALQFRLAGIRELLGYSSLERRWLLRHAPRPPRGPGGTRLPEPMTLHYTRLLESVGIPERGQHLELTVNEEEDGLARAALLRLGLEAGEPYFAINPGASFGASKFWTREGFVGTVQGLHAQDGVRSLILCGPGEEELAAAIARDSGEAAIDTSAAPLPLELLKPVLRDARLLVTTDTGPRHIATAFGVPTVVVMGPTDPRYTATNLERTRVLRVDVDCGPCHLKTCPLDHRCMTRLTARDALEACAELLSRPSGGRRARIHA
jgi:heptosyltransferase-2